MRVFKQPAERIWPEGARLLEEKLDVETRRGRKCLLLLSGGSAVKIYLGLAEYIKNSHFTSDNLAVGQADERFRPQGTSDDKNNLINAENIEKTGLIKILNRKKIPFYKISQSGTLDNAAESYEKLLVKLFQNYSFRTAVLGIGTDGHTAGLLTCFTK